MKQLNVSSVYQVICFPNDLNWLARRKVKFIGIEGRLLVLSPVSGYVADHYWTVAADLWKWLLSTTSLFF